MKLLNNMIFYSLNTYLELNYLWYFSVFFFTLQVLLSKMFELLFLKEKAFKTFSAASADDIKEMWKYLELFGGTNRGQLKTSWTQQMLERQVLYLYIFFYNLYYYFGNIAVFKHGSKNFEFCIDCEYFSDGIQCW